MTNYKYCLAVFILILSEHFGYGQNVVRYDLTVTDTIVNFSGKEKRAIAVNGQIPMPTLTPLQKGTLPKLWYITS
jgi:hypothetical protein